MKRIFIFIFILMMFNTMPVFAEEVESIGIEETIKDVSITPDPLIVNVLEKNEVKLSWKHIGAEEYIVLRDGKEITKTKDSSYIDTGGLEQEMPYTYSVIGVYPGGIKSMSTEPIVARTNKIEIKEVTGLKTDVVTLNEISLKWDNMGYSKYRVFLNNKSVGDVEENSYIFKNLKPNQIYELAVSGIGKNGQLGKIASVRKRTLPLPKEEDEIKENVLPEKQQQDLKTEIKYASFIVLPIAATYGFYIYKNKYRKKKSII